MNEYEKKKNKQKNYQTFCINRSGPEVMKLFFMLNSAENEIYSAYKK